MVGVLGNLGPPEARKYAEKADLLVTLGVGFSKQTNVPLDRPIVQVDLDPIKLGKTPQTIGLWGDCGVVLSRLLERVPERRDDARETAIAAGKARWASQLAAEAGAGETPLRPPFIMQVLSEVLPADAVIGLDVGENGWWFGRNFVSRGQRFAMSGYLATMGFGFPATIAAKLAYPDRPAVCITGDGGFVMAMGELVTAVRRGLAMTICVLNNHQYGMIQQEQAMEGYPNFGTDLTNPDFAAYARACGADGVRIDDARGAPARARGSARRGPGRAPRHRDRPAAVPVTDPVTVSGLVAAHRCPLRVLARAPAAAARVGAVRDCEADRGPPRRRASTRT